MDIQTVSQAEIPLPMQVVDNVKFSQLIVETYGHLPVWGVINPTYVDRRYNAEQKTDALRLNLTYAEAQQQLCIDRTFKKIILLV